MSDATQVAQQAANDAQAKIQSSGSPVPTREQTPLENLEARVTKLEQGGNDDLLRRISDFLDRWDKPRA